MSLQEKRERFKCQQKSSGYSSFENSSGDDAGMGDTEIRSDKEHSAVLAEISQGNVAPRLSLNEVDRSETAVDKCVGVGLGVDINDSKLLSGANGSCNCEERGVAPVINSSDTNEGTGTDINNANELINSPKAERGDNAIDNYEFVDNLVPEGFDKEKEHIEIKANCESGDIALPTDTNDSAELLPVKTTTSATVSNNQNTDGLNSGVLSKSRGLSLKTASSDNYGLNTVEENVRKRTQSGSSESDDYRVEKTQLKETCAVPSYRPQLCSTPTDTYNLSVSGAFIQSKEHCDGHRSSISSSASSLASNMSDYKIMKRHSAVVKIDGHTNFFRVQTVKYVHHKKKSKQNYMKQLHEEDKEIEGDIGLRPGDLLLEAQGKSLEDRSQKDVLHIFKKIKQDKNDKIRIQLVFRRWETREEDGTNRTYEVDYELKLVLAPDSPDSTPETHRSKIFQRHRGRLHRQYTFKVEELKKSETGRKTKLPKGQIDNITPRGHEDHRIQSVYFGNEGFITADHDGLVSLRAWDGITASENVFTFTYFRGMDRSQEPLSTYLYCARISSPGPTDVRYLTSYLHSHNEVILQTSRSKTVTAPDDVDETCFILREIGREVLFESLLHRGFYVGCRRGKDGLTSFVMTEKTKRDVINDDNLEDVTFKQWPVKVEKRTGKFTQVFQSLLSCTGNQSNLMAKSVE